MPNKSGKTRVPKKDSEFDTYIRNSTDHLLSTRSPTEIYLLLGLTDAEMKQWEEFRKDWVNTYPLYTNLDTRTVTITNRKNTIKKNFSAFTESLLTRMEGSANLIEADRIVLHLPEPDRTPTRRGVIPTAPDVALTPLEGAQVRQRLRVDADSTKASMHPLADAWERVYKIGSPAPINPAACPLKDIGTKALITFDGGMENDGKKLYAFFRWLNTTNAANNGPYSPMAVVTLSGGTAG